MGAEGQHCRFNATTADGIPVGCVLFSRAKDYASMLHNGARVDVAGELEINEFRGERKLQIRVRDIRESK